MFVGVMNIVGVGGDNVAVGGIGVGVGVEVQAARSRRAARNG